LKIWAKKGGAHAWRITLDIILSPELVGNETASILFFSKYWFTISARRFNKSLPTFSASRFDDRLLMICVGISLDKNLIFNRLVFGYLFYVGDYHRLCHTCSEFDRTRQIIFNRILRDIFRVRRSNDENEGNNGRNHEIKPNFHRVT